MGGCGIAAKGNPRGAEIRLRACGKGGVLQGETLRMAAVVRIHAGDHSSPRKLQSPVQGRSNAAVRHVKDAQRRRVWPRPCADRFFQKTAAVVVGAVVEGQNFRRRQGRVRRAALRGQTRQTGMQGRAAVGGGVIDGKKNGNFGAHERFAFEKGTCEATAQRRPT